MWMLSWNVYSNKRGACGPDVELVTKSNIDQVGHGPSQNFIFFIENSRFRDIRF